MSQDELKKFNIPIYRAERKDSKGEYATGYYHPNFFMCMGDEICDTISTKKGVQWEIDPSTLSINFEDMLDSDDAPIFASLSKDGKGGDIIKGKYHKKHKVVVVFDDGRVCKLLNGRDKTVGFSICNETKVIGIQK